MYNRTIFLDWLSHCQKIIDNYQKLHGNESENYIKKIKDNNDIKIIKKIGINNKKDTLLTKRIHTS